MDDKMGTETEEAAKERLIAEAKTLKVIVDPSWSSSQMETQIAKKRPKAPTEAKAVDQEKVAMAAELAETQMALEATKKALDAAEDMIVSMKVDAEGMKAKYEALSAKEFEQFNELSDVKVKLFEFEQKAAGVVDVEEASEDFEPKRDDAPPATVTQPPVKKATASGKVVKCIVTKFGHNQLFTGADDGSRYPEKSVLMLPETVALDQESKGFVEIQ